MKPEQAERFNDLELVNLLSVSLPFHPAEKQALLEAATLKDREKVLARSAPARQRSRRSRAQTTHHARSIENKIYLLPADVVNCPLSERGSLGDLLYDQIGRLIRSVTTSLIDRAWPGVRVIRPFLSRDAPFDARSAA